MTRGLKPVHSRRNDALSRLGWDRLELLLGEYFRAQGYQVEHVGTANGKHRFDGGIDLKLRKDGAYVLVQCKHWNAYQVPHNVVHELLGLMVNEGASAAMVVTSGEFTHAAREAAQRRGSVQLIDGDELRQWLGPLSEPQSPEHSRFDVWQLLQALINRGIGSTSGKRLAGRIASHAVRHLSRRAARSGKKIKILGLIKAVIALIFIIVFFALLLPRMSAHFSRVVATKPAQQSAAPRVKLPPPPRPAPPVQARRLVPTSSTGNIALALENIRAQVKTLDGVTSAIWMPDRSLMLGMGNATPAQMQHAVQSACRLIRHQPSVLQIVEVQDTRATRSNVIRTVCPR